jgi:hypothetical protein
MQGQLFMAYCRASLYHILLYEEFTGFNAVYQTLSYIL